MRALLSFLIACALVGCGGDDDGDDSDATRICGGLQGLSCRDGEYCSFDDLSCGAADTTGSCKLITQVCTEIFAPVCGCDGITYGNECFAAGAGVSVQSHSACAE